MQLVVPKGQQTFSRVARDHQPQGMGIAKPMLLLLLAEIRQAWQSVNFCAVNRQGWPGFTKGSCAERLTAIGQHRHSLEQGGSHLGQRRDAEARIGSNQG